MVRICAGDLAGPRHVNAAKIIPVANLAHAESPPVQCAALVYRARSLLSAHALVRTQLA